jgi:hypothetical protein
VAFELFFTNRWPEMSIDITSRRRCCRRGSQRVVAGPSARWRAPLRHTPTVRSTESVKRDGPARRFGRLYITFVA